MLGPNHTLTIQVAHNLGILYFNQGRLEEAQEMCQRALENHEKVYGSDHTSTLKYDSYFW